MKGLRFPKIVKEIQLEVVWAELESKRIFQTKYLTKYFTLTLVFTLAFTLVFM